MPYIDNLYNLCIMKLSMHKKAISYIRFSTPDQSKGDSYRRQYQATKKYCKDHDISLDESFYDKGVSAFKGVNRSKGDFARLLKKVESGDIPKGSLLIVESLDRISRDDPYKALPQFMDLMSQGIDILTLVDGFIHSAENSDPLRLIVALMTIIRANEESQTKSKRLSSAWHNKRKNAADKKLTRIGPNWLRLNSGTQDWEKIDERVAIVKEIYELSLSGCGKRSIAKTLNKRKEPIWSTSKRNKSGLWPDSYIQKILTNAAVIGAFQPHTKIDGKRQPTGDVIPNYFPAIIDQKLFYAVQNKKKKRTHKGGRSIDKAHNLFTSIARCGCCGAKLNYSNKGSGWKYLICQNAINAKGCKAKNIKYGLVEEFVLQEVLYLNLLEMENSGHEITELRTELESKEELLSSHQKRVHALVDNISNSETYSKALNDKLSEVETEAEAVESEIEKLKSDIANYEQSTKEITQVREITPIPTERINPKIRRTIKSIISNMLELVIIQRLGDKSVGIVLLMKNKHVCIGKISSDDVRQSCHISQWQLDKSHKRNAVVYDMALKYHLSLPDAFSKEGRIAPLKPRLVTIEKGESIVSELISDSIDRHLNKYIPAKKTVGIGKHNKAVTEQFVKDNDLYKSMCSGEFAEEQLAKFICEDN